MGDKRRHLVFTNFILEKFPNSNVIIDVATGKGILSRLLSKNGKIVISFDKNPRYCDNDLSIIYKSDFFNSSFSISGELIIGMHPDEATWEIIEFAGKNKIPFAVVPCCLKGRGSNNVKDYFSWIKLLEMTAKEKGFKVYSRRLNFKNKNIVIWGHP